MSLMNLRGPAHFPNRGFAPIGWTAPMMSLRSGETLLLGGGEYCNLFAVGVMKSQVARPERQPWGWESGDGVFSIIDSSSWRITMINTPTLLCNTRDQHNDPLGDVDGVRLQLTKAEKLMCLVGSAGEHRSYRWWMCDVDCYNSQVERRIGKVSAWVRAGQKWLSGLMLIGKVPQMSYVIYSIRLVDVKNV